MKVGRYYRGNKFEREHNFKTNFYENTSPGSSRFVSPAIYFVYLWRHLTSESCDHLVRSPSLITTFYNSQVRQVRGLNQMINQRTLTYLDEALIVEPDPSQLSCPSWGNSSWLASSGDATVLPLLLLKRPWPSVAPVSAAAASLAPWRCSSLPSD